VNQIAKVYGDPVALRYTTAAYWCEALGQG
jgi:hypothetical protein